MPHSQNQLSFLIYYQRYTDLLSSLSVTHMRNISTMEQTALLPIFIKGAVTLYNFVNLLYLLMSIHWFTPVL